MKLQAIIIQVIINIIVKLQAIINIYCETTSDINIIVKLQAIIIHSDYFIFIVKLQAIIIQAILIFIVKLQAIIIQVIINIYCETTSDY